MYKAYLRIWDDGRPSFGYALEPGQTPFGKKDVQVGTEIYLHRQDAQQVAEAESSNAKQLYRWRNQPPIGLYYGAVGIIENKPYSFLIVAERQLTHLIDLDYVFIGPFATTVDATLAAEAHYRHLNRLYERYQRLKQYVESGVG